MLSAVHYSSASEHWCTPPWFCELVAEAQGGIDLDPCANAHSVVPATLSYTARENGLILPWTGRIYANPPYGRKCGLFTATMRLRRNEVTCATFLVAARPDTEWFQRDIAPTASALCWWAGRVVFLAWNEQTGQLEPARDKQGHAIPAPFPSLVAYWGPEPVPWARVFSRHGAVVICRGSRAGMYPKRG